MVRPQMEYASVIWDPYYISDRDKLESIQQRATRWVLSDYSRTSSVSLMLHQLSWPTLQIRRNISRLQLFYKIFHHQISLSTTTYYLPVTRDTQHYHPYHFILPPVTFINHITSQGQQNRGGLGGTCPPIQNVRGQCPPKIWLETLQHSQQHTCTKIRSANRSIHRNRRGINVSVIQLSDRYVRRYIAYSLVNHVMHPIVSHNRFIYF